MGPPISLVPRLIGPPSHWSPISWVLRLIGPPIGTQAPPITLVPLLIGLPSHWTLFSLASPFISSHYRVWTQWCPFSLVHRGNPFNYVLIDYPSHWSSNATLVTQFLLAIHLIGPQRCPWVNSDHWSPISLVPQYNPSHWSPISLVPVLVGPPPPPPSPPPSHWSPHYNPFYLFSLVLHLIGPPT